ncbi:hypothetical protein B7988_06905 [Fibrobacter sp. UWB1]|uniref:Coenzyme F420 hydrogenase/dehydrogenase, beta subunit C-terminal domain n=1 Tax=Fibrobacter sp. UWB1 TaxID=1964355 RepID=UPI000B521B4C|nr:Coenzyme F420 hydrogenase/dehydrogenase, beta subunit C-terminal domain [Fibrobacter sp. UWB1]OWV26307.1 hypothetical protein B7988_06905 [Fibrobacter sp. UWB1]
MSGLGKKIHLCNQSQCTGCMACKQRCKANAISVKNLNGFLYPEIDFRKCKSCGMCMDVCPILNHQNKIGNCHKGATSVIAAWSKNPEIRMKSSSGGIFSTIASNVLKKGGIVFGAAWQKDMRLAHVYIECVEELDSLRRSKYVQSDIGESYSLTESFLRKGKSVLFCGTPCQIAGLRSFLKQSYDNLYTLDVLCQGVPSQAIFQKYLAEYEALHKTKVIDCNFRTKIRGWRCGLLLLLQTTKGKKYCFLNKNEYYNAFFKEFFMRESCYTCKFKEHDLGYFSDITVADFWRIGNKEKFDISDYEKGVSAIIVNTDKGQSLLKECSDQLNMVDRKWSEFATNGGLYCSKKPSRNDEALAYLCQHSWAETQKKYFPLGKKYFMQLRWLVFGEKNIRRLSRLKQMVKCLMRKIKT